MAHSMARLWARLVAMNDGWARPFGEFNRRWAMALFRPIYPIKDLLNGRWLGHPLHAALTDIPIGLLLGVVVLDILGQPAAADIVLVGTIVFMLLAALSGLADYSDTTGTALTRGTLHATIMVVTLVILIVSAVMRWGAPVDRTVPIALSIIGFVLISIGAFVGGDVAYVFGNMVSRHAFRGPGTKWVALDMGSVTDLKALPEATPTKMRAGINDLLVVRMGDTVHAMHNVCAHAGGPLNEGKLVDDCIECPWHGSRYRLTDGSAQRGPTVYDQPSYEIRSAEGGGYEVRRRPAQPASS
jgi:nitrite reductase/ring-hydroxylating ferredoxin subunit